VTSDGPPDGAVRATATLAQRRARIAATCLVLVGLAFVQDAGRIVPDSKLDLTANPLGWLEKALHLWDPEGFFGQLQNQAYGYFLPAGPFFVVGDLLGLPEWVVQRAWWSLVLCVAFVGMVRLAEAMGIGTETTRLLAALLFALSPRVVSVIGAVSVEVWPLAVAPWVLAPLVRVSRLGGSPRRAAAGSALAVMVVGGVNAVATLAVLVLPVLWLLTRQPGASRRRLASWWVPSVLVATAWWLVPLLTLGLYSPPFLDWIEDAGTTSAHTSLAESLAGMSHWLSYLATASGPVWPAGFTLVTTGFVVLNAMVLVSLGLAGLARRDLTERRFLVGALLVGLVLVGLGYTGTLSGLAASTRQEWLDGLLAPLRNTHKFDVVIRVPLVLGVAHALADLDLPGMARSWSARLTAVVAVAAGVATSGVALIVGLAAPGSYDRIPDYWHEAAEWLEENVQAGRSLVVPGASFARFVWGTTRDEPLQALSDSAWGVRDAVPLSSAGNIRMLDAVEQRLQAGQPSPGLASYLARMGVSHVVVRNDLDRSATLTPRPLQVRAALVGSPGLTPVASFGPLVGGESESDVRTVDGRLDLPLPAVEVWRVGGVEDLRARRVDVADVVVLSGAPEALLELHDMGASPGATVVDGDDTVDLSAQRRWASGAVVSDSFALREVDYGSMRDNTSASLERDAPLVLNRRVRDYFVPGTEGREAAAGLSGLTSVAASSSGGDVRSLRARGPEHQPWSAIDGDVRSAWVSGDLEPAVGQWWQVDFDSAVAQETVYLTLVDDPGLGSPVRSLLITSDAGTRTVDVDPRIPRQPLAVPVGPTSFLRLEVASVLSGAGGGVGIAEVEIPGVTARRSLGVPWWSADRAATVVLSTDPGYQPECIAPADRPVCGPQLGRVGAEQSGLDRLVDVGVPGLYDISLRVRPRYGEQLERLLDFDDGRMQATASSRALNSPLGRPAAAVDRDLATGWVADPSDPRPQLTITWGPTREVSGFQVLRDSFLPASRPLDVLVGVGGRTLARTVDERGFVRFPPVRTDRLSLEFIGIEPLVSVDPATGAESVLPVGLSEVRVTGADDVRKSVPKGASTGLPCGFGPRLTVSDVEIDTSVTMTVGALLGEETVRATVCREAPLGLVAGPTSVTVTPSSEFDVVSVTLDPSAPSGAGPGPGRQGLQIRQWDPTARSITVDRADRDSWLVLPENYNPGWSASVDGVDLATARVDGWALGIMVPAGVAGDVDVGFAPDQWYRAGLAAGPIGLLLLAVWRMSPGGGLIPVIAERRRHTWLLALLSAGAMAVLAGVVGLVAWLVAVALLDGRRAAWAWGVVLLGGLVSGLAWATDPWPGSSRASALLTQAVLVVSLAALAASAVREAPSPGRGGTDVDPAPRTSDAGRDSLAGTS
jgi:arabinofuranan 3-O-arabinosyltransferase